MRGEGRRHNSHSSQCAASVSQFLFRRGSNALRLRACWAGRILYGSRHAGRKAHYTSSKARQSSSGGIHQESARACTEVSNRAAQRLAHATRTSKMRAIRIHNYGGPEVLHDEDAPRPEPQAGEVLVRVHAAGVNPIDWKVCEGHMKDFWPHKFPLILGWDLSGVVEELGPGPAAAGRFKIGGEVYSLPDPTRNGAYADYIVVREPELALKPNSLHHIRAAAVPLAALTAWQSLFDTAQLQPGQRLLIHAGSGGVGHLAVQLAKWKGAYVFATASTKNQDLLRKLGVDEPIDYTQQRFEEIARKIDIVLDTLGDETQERSWSVLKKGGVLVSLVQPPSEEKAKELGVRAALLGARPSAEQLSEIAKIIDSGKLAPVFDRILH